MEWSLLKLVRVVNLMLFGWNTSSRLAAQPGLWYLVGLVGSAGTCKNTIDIGAEDEDVAVLEQSKAMKKEQKAPAR